MCVFVSIIVSVFVSIFVSVFVSLFISVFVTESVSAWKSWQISGDSCDNHAVDKEAFILLKR